MQDEHGIMARAIPFSGLQTTLFVVKGNKMSLEMAQLRMDHPYRQEGEKKFNELKDQSYYLISSLANSQNKTMVLF